MVIKTRERLINQITEMGVKFPSRQRFVLNLIDGELGIMTTENKSKIKLENEKFFSNKTYLLSGESATLDIVECQSAEEYVDKLLDLRNRWLQDKVEEEEK